MTESLRRDAPDELEWSRFEGFVHKLRGRLALAQQQWGEALRFFQDMLKVRQRIAEAQPENPDWHSELANAHSLVAKAARKDNQPQVALQHYLDAYRILDQLWRDHPQTIDYAILLSNSEVGLGAAFVSQGTEEGDASAYRYLKQAQRRLTKLRLAHDVRAWESFIAKDLDAVDRNLAILNGSDSSTTSDVTP